MTEHTQFHWLSDTQNVVRFTCTQDKGVGVDCFQRWVLHIGRRISILSPSHRSFNFVLSWGHTHQNSGLTFGSYSWIMCGKLRGPCRVKELELESAACKAKWPTNYCKSPQPISCVLFTLSAEHNEISLWFSASYHLSRRCSKPVHGGD